MMSDRSTDQAREDAALAKWRHAVGDRELTVAGNGLAARLRVVLKERDEAVYERDGRITKESAKVLIAESNRWANAYEKARDELAAVKADLLRAEEALQPFAEFGERETDENGWTSREHHQSISTWLGPSDFRAAADYFAARAALSPKGQLQK